MQVNGRKKVDLLATTAIIGSLCCWSAGPIFIKYFTGYIDFWTQNFLRYLTACIFWLPFLIYSVRKRKVKNIIWKIALLPAAANVVMQCFWAASFYYIDPTFMNLLIKSSLVWIAIFSIVFFEDERPLVRSKRFWLGLTLSVAGVCGVLACKEGFAERTTIIGIILALFAAFFWAVYTLTVRAAFKQADSRISFAVICIYTVLGLGLLELIFGEFAESLHMGVRQWLYLIISGIIPIAISHVLYYMAIKRIGATIPSLVLLASPFTVLAGSYIVFGETLSALQVVFGLVLIAGSALAIWAQEHLKIT